MNFTDLHRYVGVPSDSPFFLCCYTSYATRSAKSNAQASPWIQSVNVAAMVAGCVPSVTAMAVSISTQVAARAAIEVQGRMRTNAYLDQINESLFHPRNLHCMVMTFKPDQTNEEFIDVDVNSVNTALTKSLSETSKMGKLKGSSGISKGEFSIPEAAPLIYPALDKAASAVRAAGKPVSAQKQNALKRSGRSSQTTSTAGHRLNTPVCTATTRTWPWLGRCSKSLRVGMLTQIIPQIRELLWRSSRAAHLIQNHQQVGGRLT